MPDKKGSKTSQAFFAFYGPWAVVAGASEGLGAAYASELASLKFNLVLIARNVQRLTSLSNELSGKYGVQVKELVLDLAKQETIEKIGAETAELDVGLLVYNAAFAPSGPFLGMSAQTQEQVFDTNCRAPLLLTHLFASRMRTRYKNRHLRSGIILMSSLSGFQGSPYLAHYAASKAYNIILAEGLREEFKELGIDVLACCAGAIATPGYMRQSQSRKRKSRGAMQPEKVASAALQSLGKRTIKIPGFFNNLGSSVMRHLLPRHVAVLIMKSAVSNLLKSN